MKKSPNGYLIVVNIVMEKRFSGIKNNGIISEPKTTATPGYAFIPSSYEALCSKDMITRLDRAKTAFIQVSNHDKIKDLILKKHSDTSDIDT